MAQVFISYKSSERDEVAKIAIGLQGSGFTVWWDHALVGGQDYSQVIDREIAAAKVVMPIWSKDSVRSPWVSAEAERGGDKLFPVKIDDVQPPLPYNRLQTLDLRGWSGNPDDPRWRRLVADLNAIISGQQTLQSIPVAETKHKTRLRPRTIAAWIAAPTALLSLAFVVIQNFTAIRNLVSPSEAAQIGQTTDAKTGPDAPSVAPPPSAPAREERPPPASANTERGIQTYADAVDALRRTGSRVSLEICRPATGQCGATEVRIGEVITVRVASQVTGRLVLLDENARGEQTQIFPNGITSAASELRLIAGRSVDLPLANHGFVFGVSEPVGPSRLIAMILPETAPLPEIVAENATERGIAAVPRARRDEFAVSVAEALPADGARPGVAIGELSYTVTR